MIRPIVLSVVFVIGILFSIYEVFVEFKSLKDKKSGIISYKIKYFSLWIVVYLYLVYTQIADLE